MWILWFSDVSLISGENRRGQTASVSSHTRWFPLASLTQMACFITAIFSSVVFLMWEASMSTRRIPYQWRDTDCCRFVPTYGHGDLAGCYVWCSQSKDKDHAGNIARKCAVYMCVYRWIDVPTWQFRMVHYTVVAIPAEVRRGYTGGERSVSFYIKDTGCKWLCNSDACHPGNETRQGDMMKVTSWNAPNNTQVLFFFFFSPPAQSTLLSYWCSHPHFSQIIWSSDFILWNETKRRAMFHLHYLFMNIIFSTLK